MLPQTFVDYVENPREYMLTAVTTVLDVHTRVSDLYSSPYNQISEQLRLIIETIKERQESELINNKEYGLLHNVAAEAEDQDPHRSARLRTTSTSCCRGSGRSRAFFLTHPAAIAAFGREATRRGVPPPTVSLFGSQFLTWRGIPLVPSDKVPLRRQEDPDHARCARERAGREWWASSSRTCRASRASASRCASWASTTRRSRPI